MNVSTTLIISPSCPDVTALISLPLLLHMSVDFVVISSSPPTNVPCGSGFSLLSANIILSAQAAPNPIYILQKIVSHMGIQVRPPESEVSVVHPLSLQI